MTTLIEVDTDLHTKITAAIDARDEGFAQAESADPTCWNRRLINQVITHYAALGKPFSANDLDHWLPDVRHALIGRQFQALSQAGVIRPVGWTISARKSTHASPIRVWRGTSKAVEAELSLTA